MSEDTPTSPVPAESPQSALNTQPHPALAGLIAELETAREAKKLAYAKIHAARAAEKAAQAAASEAQEIATRADNLFEQLRSRVERLS